jgi:hypothetical protein
MPYVQLSQQHKEMQNNLDLHSKTPLEIIVQTSTMLFIISNLDRGATNNLMIVMRKLVLTPLVQLWEVLLQIQDLPLIQ